MSGLGSGEQQVQLTQVGSTSADPPVREMKSVASHYPQGIPSGAPGEYPQCPVMTRQVLIMHVGPSSKSLVLEHWGKIETIPYVPKPLRGCKCQCYGHHQKRRTYSEVCAVCSKTQATSESMDKLKTQQKARTRCVNCQGWGQCPGP